VAGGFLLDTHVWLWMQSSPGRLPADLLDRLADDQHKLFLSSASSWEIAIKYALGKLALPEPPAKYVPDRMLRSDTTGLAVEHGHALAVADLPLLHRDPFDRMLIAQARGLGLCLITADPLIAQYDVDHELIAR
jgi:PIN domain nuclease of toxin-antitoxin system